MYKRDLAQVAFDAYAKNKGGKTYDNKPIPKWEDVGEDVKRAWRAAAEAVKAEIVYQQISGL